MNVENKAWKICILVEPRNFLIVKLNLVLFPFSPQATFFYFFYF